jgi:hypothetical protein
VKRSGLRPLEQPDDDVGDVVDVDRLHPLFAVADPRQDGEGGERGEELAAATATAADERGAQHAPIEPLALGIERGEAQVGGGLRAVIARPRPLVGAERRDLHDAPHPGGAAGSEERARRCLVHGVEAVARRLANEAGRIDDGVDAGEVRQPARGRGQPGEIDDGAAAAGAALRQRSGTPPGTDRLMAPLGEAADEPPADEPGGAGHQHPHRALRQRDGGGGRRFSHTRPDNGVDDR